MGNSLVDQLKKTGLIDEKKAKQAKKEHHQQRKRKKGKQQAQPAGGQQQVIKAQAEKAARDRQLNLQQKQVAEKKALQAQARQMIEQHQIKEEGGGIRYHFTDGTTVQRLFVSESIHSQLSAGKLAIVKTDDSYAVVPVEVGRKIKERDPDSFITVASPANTPSMEDDPYAQYQVPDDLMW